MRETKPPQANAAGAPRGQVPLLDLQQAAPLRVAERLRAAIDVPCLPDLCRSGDYQSLCGIGAED